MAPTDKAKAAGVSVTSFFDLKAELAKKSDEFAKNKAAGGPKYVAGQARRPEKVRSTQLSLNPRENLTVVTEAYGMGAVE
jgi:hypothetical protein